MQFQCESCQRELQVVPQAAGRLAKCCYCGQNNVAPGGLPNDVFVVQSSEGRTYGPVAFAVLDQWVTEGRVSHECRIRRQQATHWLAATEFYPQLQPQKRRRSGSPFKPDFVATSFNPYSIPHRGVGLLILSIVGLAVPCGVFSLPALLLAVLDLRQIWQNKMDRRGLPWLVSTIIISGIGLAVTIGSVLWTFYW